MCESEICYGSKAETSKRGFASKIAPVGLRWVLKRDLEVRFPVGLIAFEESCEDNPEIKKNWSLVLVEGKGSDWSSVISDQKQPKALKSLSLR